MKEHQEAPPEGDEQDLRQLLREAGPRAQPSAAARERVRRAVAASWQDTVAKRRRQAWTWRLAAGLVLAAGLGAWLAGNPVAPPAGPAATVVRVAGALQLGRPLGWDALVAGDAVAASDRLRTLPESGAVLQLDQGTRVRLGPSTQVDWPAPGHLALRRGAVFIVAEADEGALPLVVDTPFGSVRHLGTRYLVAVHGDGMSVGVRDGRVRLQGGGEAAEAHSGEQLQLTAAGELTRAPLATYGDAWRWVDALATPFTIEGRSLAEFLDWVGRETGRVVRYGSPAAAEEARTLRLRGDVSQLAPQNALHAVLATTRLVLVPDAPADTLRVDLPPPR